MHCPNCGERVPKGDKTVCPHCGLDLLTSLNIRPRYPLSSNSKQKEKEKLREKLVIERSREKHHHRKVGSFALLGGTLFILAIAIGFAFGRSIVPSQDSSFLLYAGLVSGTLGMVILVVSMFTYSYSSPYASRERIKQGKVMSVYDAMWLHVYYPTWMRDWTFGWIPFIPIGALLLLGAIRHALASAILLTIFYGGAVMLYQYLYARRWVAKQRNKEVV